MSKKTQHIGLAIFALLLFAGLAEAGCIEELSDCQQSAFEQWEECLETALEDNMYCRIGCASQPSCGPDDDSHYQACLDACGRELEDDRDRCEVLRDTGEAICWAAFDICVD